MLGADQERFVITNNYAGFGEFDILYFVKRGHKHGTITKRPEITIYDEDDPKLLDRPEPLLRVNEKALIQLMDELWRAGIRPSNGEGSVGMIGSLKDHLNDMRIIAFNKLGIKDGKLI